MNQESTQQPTPVDPTSPSSDLIPGKSMLLTMRLLALGGFLITTLLMSVSIITIVANKTAKVPFCSAVEWFNCDTVIHSHWGKWFGIPVSCMAFVLYIIVLYQLFTLSAKKSHETLFRKWWILSIAADCIAFAAVWFTYLQAFKLNVFCPYCIADHAIGLFLAVLIFNFVKKQRLFTYDRPARISALFIPSMLTGLLIAGQVLITPSYGVDTNNNANNNATTPPPATGNFKSTVVTRDNKKYINATDFNKTIEYGKYPIIGNRETDFMLIEVIDYTCPRCKSLWSKLRAAKEDNILPSEMGITVLFYPLSHKCNSDYPDTGSRHLEACILAKLATAVWIAAPDKFEEYHDWLFSMQGNVSGPSARAKADRLVNPKAIDDALPKAETLLTDSISESIQLQTRSLPGFYLSSFQFTELPVNYAELINVIKKLGKK